ncbi:MAG: ABC transporter permease [Kofleriaceae bacterium]
MASAEAEGRRPEQPTHASARRRLLLGELASARGQWLAVGVAIAAALLCVGTARGARPLVERSMAIAMASRHVAEATLILPAGVDDALLAEVRARPELAEAERRQTAQARVRSARGWEPVVVFASGAEPPRLDAFAAGAWPPPPGALLVERSSREAMPALRADRIELKLPTGEARQLAVAGVAHDPGVAASWQEHRGYAYTTLDTLVQLGADARYDELLVAFAPAPRSQRDAEARAMALANTLADAGHVVAEVRVPPLGQHPHGGLLFAVQLILLLFGGLLLILVSVVLATLLSAQLARKTRELGVLKAIGASSGQLVALYASLVLVLSLGAFAVAAPLARLGSEALSARVLAMMNLDLVQEGASSGFAFLLALAVVVPLAVSLRPILRAARRPVREALAHHGASSDFVSPALTRLPVPLRNALRRPARLAYALTLLALAGAMVLAAANVRRGLTEVAGKVDRGRRFDVELRLYRPTSPSRVEFLRDVPGVERLEAWSALPVGMPDEHDGHGEPDEPDGHARSAHAPRGARGLHDLLRGTHDAPDAPEAPGAPEAHDTPNAPEAPGASGANEPSRAHRLLARLRGAHGAPTPPKHAPDVRDTHSVDAPSRTHHLPALLGGAHDAHDAQAPRTLARPDVQQPGALDAATSGSRGAARAREAAAEIPLARTYRDGGHGLSQLMAAPPGSRALTPPVLRGRWLREEGDDDAIVLSQAHPATRATSLGGRVELVVAGRRASWRLVGVVDEIAGASAFVTAASFHGVTGDDGVTLLRISTRSGASAALIDQLERRLAAAGVGVEYAMPTPELRAIIDDHVALVTRAIILLSSLLGLVGFFALGAMTATGVAERTREIGVLKTLGASARRLAAIFLGEALLIAALSAVAAFALSAPLTELVRKHVALGSLTPQFAISAAAALGWLIAVLAGSTLAAWIPARRAARLSVREALAES